MRTPTIARVVVLATLALTLAAPSATPAAASSPPQWGTPVVVYPELPFAWFPDISADATGTFHLVYGGNLSSDPDTGNGSHAWTGTVMYTRLEQQGWIQPADIEVMDAGIATHPMIIADKRYVHIIFRTSVFGVVRLYYARALPGADLRNAHSWSTPIPLSDGDAYYAQIKELADGTIVVTYDQVANTVIHATPEPGTPSSTPGALIFRTEIMARRSTDGGSTWSVPAHVSATPERAVRNSLAVGPDQRTLIAAWDEGYDNLTGQGDPIGGGTAISTDGGATWQNQQEVRSPRGPFEQTAVAFGASGALLVYQSVAQPQLLYRQSTDAGRHWSEERVVPGVVTRPYPGKHNFNKITLAADGDGRLLLAYVGQDQQAPNGLGVFVSTFAGENWSAPAEIAAPVGYPEDPCVAVALGNRVQVVYFVRDNAYESGHYTIWSVAGQSDAKAIAPASPPPAVITRPVAQPTLPPVRILPYPTIVAPAPLTAEQQRHGVSPQAIMNGPAFASFKAVLPLLALVLIAAAGVRRLSKL